MDTKDLLTVIGWPVTFILGILAGGLIIPRITKKRRVLAWAAIEDVDVIPRELSETLGLPVLLQVGSDHPKSLSIIGVRLGNVGNEPLEKTSMAILFNQGSKILNVRLAEDLGEYAKHVSWDVKGTGCQVQTAFMNPGFHFELEFLVSEYEAGSAEVDAPAPGLEVRRRDASRWQIPRSWTHGLTLNPWGLGYSRSEASMTQIAEELTALRRLLSRRAPPS